MGRINLVPYFTAVSALRPLKTISHSSVASQSGHLRDFVSISRPCVQFRDGPNGREEPYETVVIDVDDEHADTKAEKMAQRKGQITELRPSGGGKTRITFSAPSRGLIGYHSEFLSDTRGTGIQDDDIVEVTAQVCV